MKPGPRPHASLRVARAAAKQKKFNHEGTKHTKQAQRRTTQPRFIREILCVLRVCGVEFPRSPATDFRH
jgi:hypothetical protein